MTYWADQLIKSTMVACVLAMRKRRKADDVELRHVQQYVRMEESLLDMALELQDKIEGNED